MEDQKKKKKKLTLSISSKKKIEPFSYTRGIKKSVLVEKKIYRKKTSTSSGYQKSNTGFL